MRRGRGRALFHIRRPAEDGDSSRRGRYTAERSIAFVASKPRGQMTSSATLACCVFRFESCRSAGLPGKSWEDLGPNQGPNLRLTPQKMAGCPELSCLFPFKAIQRSLRSPPKRNPSYLTQVSAQGMRIGMTPPQAIPCQYAEHTLTVGRGCGLARKWVALVKPAVHILVADFDTYPVVELGCFDVALMYLSANCWSKRAACGRLLVTSTSSHPSPRFIHQGCESGVS